MKREKYVFNSESLSYDRYRRPLGLRILRFFGFLMLVGALSLAASGFLIMYIPSIKEDSLHREIEQMKIKYSSVNEELDLMAKVLENIQDRDANVHRMIFGIDPINEDVWNGGVGGHARYQELTNYENSGHLLLSTLEKTDRLKRQFTLQSKSLDSLLTVAGEKEKYLNSIPSIKPVRTDHLKRNFRYLSGFGMRLHPVHKIPRMHRGLDFTAAIGTPVRATGDGKVTRVRNDRTGYGRNITIDHGYGYTTLYAHMEDVDVKQGQEVKKGEQIGTVGNTGTSTAPHLHYEVRFKKKALNPIHYCMDGLSPEEYEEMVKMASQPNKSFD